MVSLTNESKNSKTLSNEEVPSGLTWDEATMTWDDAVRTWDIPGTPISKESKNTKSLSNESI